MGIRTVCIAMTMLLCSACSAPPSPSSDAEILNSKDHQRCVVDSLQVHVCVQKPANRIVVLFESGLDGLYMLKQGHKVVGIPAEVYVQTELWQAYAKLDHRIAYKQLATPSQGAQATNLESLLLLKPDLVVIGQGQTQTIDLLRQFGIAVYVMQSSTYAEVKDELADLGVLTGAEQRAKEILEFSDAIVAEVAEKTSAQANKQSVYYAWSGGRIYSTSGRKSITNDFITLAGAYNIVKTETNQPNVNPETLIEWNPENIVLWNTEPHLIYQRQELQGLKAIQQKKVFNLKPAFIYNPHTIKIILTAMTLNHLIYPNPADLNIEQLQHQILSQLYGINAAKALLNES